MSISKGERPWVAAMSLIPLCAVLSVIGRGWTVLPPAAARSLSVELGLEPEPGRPVILIAFQVIDCADSRLSLSRWNRVSDALVIGALVGPGPGDEAQTAMVLERASIDFPVRRAPSLERVLLALGHRRTPIVVVLDPGGRTRELHPLGDFPDDASIDALVARVSGAGGEAT